ncbi:hypothetical protein BC629DRAFT_291517 [Irpex lacteus]|nr:hypothetical protein BC629DRAFT_291517 [Irpex lacteus]
MDDYRHRLLLASALYRAASRHHHDEAFSTRQPGSFEEDDLPEDDRVPLTINAREYREMASRSNATPTDRDNPANTRANLQTLLNSNADFKGAPSFHRTYNREAPNPGLKLADLGTVGLPLSTREAEAVKSRCRQAPFGKGERTLVDKTVRDTWEMDAEEVSFLNPLWPTFLSEVVSDVCRALGVNILASQPRCELYKLLLYEAGSHFLPHVDTEKEDGMFATIVIVLPSTYTGGAAHLSHGQISSIYDCSTTSSYATTVLAWYTDVTHEIKPITSGFRLALSYNLVHTTTSLRPALSYDAGFVLKLRKVLQRWKDDEGKSTPSKLVCLLTHPYSQANLRASALKGVDSHKVAMLDSVAGQLGFRLGLASVECMISGQAEEYGPYDGGSKLKFGEEFETTMSITHFVDMQGSLIAGVLEVDERRETIPANLVRVVKAGKADKEEYEGYQGNYGGELSRWYRRTVLVIWPSWSDLNFALQHSGEGTANASSAANAGPSQKKRKYY